MILTKDVVTNGLFDLRAVVRYGYRRAVPSQVIACVLRDDAYDLESRLSLFTNFDKDNFTAYDCDIRYDNGQDDHLCFYFADKRLVIAEGVSVLSTLLS